ncbi:Folate-biopterin transporter 1, chloroplastic, partial [Mucuna pruriens]
MSCLVLSRLISTLSWSLMATFVDNKYNVFCILLGSSLYHLLGCCYRFNSCREGTYSHKVPQYLFSLYSLCWGSSGFRGIVSSYFSGSLLYTYGVRFIFCVTTLLPLLTLVIVILLKEQPMFNTARGQNLLFSRPSLTLLCSNLQQILLVLPLWFWDLSSLLPRLHLYLVLVIIMDL